MFNLVSGTNEARRIARNNGTKRVSVIIDLTVVFVIINNVGMMVNAGVNANN